VPGPPTFDLQSHSVHSDGALAPEEVVRLAAEAGVELLALSDHDSVDGVDAALEAGERHGIGVVPAVEITAVHEIHEDLHILGYGVDHRHDRLRGALAEFRADRGLRARRMAELLEGLGYAVDFDVLEERRKAGKPIGRPHLAMSAIGHPANAERLAEEGLDDVTPFIRAYLISGRPAFVSRTRPSVEEAVELIHGAGGVAVWAHPFWDLEDPDGVLRAIELFRGWGIDGVEVFYPTHTREQTGLLVERCANDGLLMTGSADFHGPGHKLFARFRAFDTYGHAPDLGPIAAASRA
jgi:predicted metal-dependent phosphoesterase TrpH